MKFPRLTVTRLMALVALSAFVVAFIIVPAVRKDEYPRLARQMSLSIYHIEPTDPGIAPAVWDCAVVMTYSTFRNVCDHPQRMPMAEMYRLRDDLDRKLGGQIDLETLAWIYERLAVTGPFGKAYSRSSRQLFDKCISQGNPGFPIRRRSKPATPNGS